MKLTKHLNANQSRTSAATLPQQPGVNCRWAVDGQLLDESTSLADWLKTDLTLEEWAADKITGETASGSVLAPVDDDTEIWASGVTYLRSRQARMHESDTADIYDRVYDADRAELFFKSIGWRAVGAEGELRFRRDASWNVPEPEITIVMNSAGKIVGFTAGNDMSSRDIEGENPLYLPQAKVYRGSCGVGPAIQSVSDVASLSDIEIGIQIYRGDARVFSGTTSTGQMKRSLEELARWLYAELDFPFGSLLMTGTGVVPPDEFSLAVDDKVHVQVGELTLENSVSS